MNGAVHKYTSSGAKFARLQLGERLLEAAMVLPEASVVPRADPKSASTSQTMPVEVVVTSDVVVGVSIAETVVGVTAVVARVVLEVVSEVEDAIVDIELAMGVGVKVGDVSVVEDETAVEIILVVVGAVVVVVASTPDMLRSNTPESARRPSTTMSRSWSPLMPNDTSLTAPLLILHPTSLPSVQLFRSDRRITDTTG